MIPLPTEKEKIQALEIRNKQVGFSKHDFTSEILLKTSRTTNTMVRFSYLPTWMVDFCGQTSR